MTFESYIFFWYSLGVTPNALLKHDVKYLGSEKPTEYAISAMVIDLFLSILQACFNLMFRINSMG